MKIYRFPASLPALVKSRPRETMLVAAAAALLIALTLFSFWLTRRVLQDAEWADELSQFNARLTEFAHMLRTAESSQRGFLISQDPKFLQPYHNMSKAMVPMLQELQLQAPSQASAKAVDALLHPLKDKLQEMEETIVFMKSGQKERAVSRLKDGLDRELTLDIENSVRAIRDRSNAVLASEEASTRSLENLKIYIDAFGSMLILTFSFLSLWLLLQSHEKLQNAQKALASVNSELEDIVAQRTAALTRANQEIQRFAYIVSHDLRSPLVNIMGFTSELETLRKDLFEKLEKAGGETSAETLGKDFDEAFGFIKSSIARMDRLIGAILRISREGSRPLNTELIDTQALVEGLFAAFAHQIREKKVTVKAVSLPPAVSDRLALEQIFSNLIENAIKFLKPGEQGQIAVAGQVQGAEVIYKVSDNGRGIDPKDHQRIFELFRRAGPQDVPGEGMGLAYVSTLVRRLGGTLSVESALGRGSVFKVTLPKTMAEGRRAA